MPSSTPTLYIFAHLGVGPRRIDGAVTERLVWGYLCTSGVAAVTWLTNAIVQSATTPITVAREKGTGFLSVHGRYVDIEQYIALLMLYVLVDQAYAQRLKRLL